MKERTIKNKNFILLNTYLCCNLFIHFVVKKEKEINLYVFMKEKRTLTSVVISLFILLLKRRRK